MSDFEIYLSDAASLLGTLPPNSVQTIIADPPYALIHQKNSGGGFFQPETFFAEAEPVLADGGALYLFTRWDAYPHWLRLIPSSFELKNLIVWVKDLWTGGDLASNFGMQHEVVLFFTKGYHKRQGRRWSNVWNFPCVPSRKLRIPTEKPVDMIARIIETSAVSGDLVVDPYCGSGTTGEALRRFKGIRGILGDIDPKMIRMTAERLKMTPPSIVPSAPFEIPSDPFYRVTPPDPHLWGIHPEDLSRFMRRYEPEIASAEEGSMDVLTAIEAIARTEDSSEP